MGRRRRKKVVKVFRRSLPDVYVCPRCGSTAIKVTIDRVAHEGQIVCSVCSLKATVPAEPHEEQVDVYCKFNDNFYAPRPSTPAPEAVQAEPSPQTAVTEAESRGDITGTPSISSPSQEPLQNNHSSNSEAGSSGDSM